MGAAFFSRIVLSTATILCAVDVTLAEPPHQQSRQTAVLDSAPFPSRLERIDDDWQIVFQTDNGPRVVAGKRLTHWGGYSDRDRGPQVLLADGSSIFAGDVTISGERIVVTSNLWRSAKLPLPAVSGIVFRPPADALQRDHLMRRIRSAEGDEDEILLENGDSIRGVLITDPRADDDQPAVRLRVKGGEIALPIETIVALVFNPALRNAASTRGEHVLVGFRDGSLLQVAEISPEGGVAKFVLRGGARLNSQPSLESIWDEIVLLQPMFSHVAYLSDLKPVGYKHIPLLELAWPYGVDRNVLQGRLRSQGQIFSKGLGMHSASRLAFDLDEPFRVFQAELAIDQAAARRGSVVFRLFVADAAGQFRLAYTSPVVRGGAKPLPISIDVSGARRIALIVDFADRGDELDHADWLNARLLK